MDTKNASDIHAVYEKLASKSQNIDISGGNHQDGVLRNFAHLKESVLPLLDPTVDGEIIDIVDNLEKSYLNRYSALSQDKPELKVNPMRVENGKVIISDGTCFHSTLDTMDRLESISNIGVLATEWYGILESELECRFCASLFTTHNGKVPKPISHYCLLYFDMNNPIMQDLLKKDFFEYVHLKRTNADVLQTTFSKETLELFEKVIVPLSPGAKIIKKWPGKEDWYWKAIPAGIPPQLINGLCISSKNVDLINNIDKLVQLFPNATIFNENREVLHFPLQKKDTEHADETVDSVAKQLSLKDISNAVKENAEKKKL